MDARWVTEPVRHFIQASPVSNEAVWAILVGVLYVGLVVASSIALAKRRIRMEGQQIRDALAALPPDTPIATAFDLVLPHEEYEESQDE